MLKIKHEPALKPGQYINEATEKKRIVLHHTAGGPFAESVINTWNTDQWGAIATHYVIGRDGTIIQAMPEKAWAFALGLTTSNYKQIEKGSIQIELCAWGWLLPNGDGTWRNCYSHTVPNDEVYVMSREKDGIGEYRRVRAFHAYSEAQIEATLDLIADIRTRHPHIPQFGDYHKMFNYSRDVIEKDMGGIYTHNTFNQEKTDIYPDRRLIQRLCPKV